MSFTDLLVVLAVFGGFGFLIWSRLVKKNHPIVEKIKEMMRKKSKSESYKEEDKWQQPNIEKRIY